MTDMMEIAFEELSRRIEAFHPDAIVGWNINLAPVPSDEAELIVEVFNIPFQREREFYRYVFPYVCEANRKLGRSISLITHDPKNTCKFYGEIVENLKCKKAGKKSFEAAAWRIVFDRIEADLQKACITQLGKTIPPPAAFA